MAAAKSDTSVKRQLLLLSKPALIRKCKKCNIATHGTKKDMIERFICARKNKKKLSSKKSKNRQLLQQSTTQISAAHIKSLTHSSNHYIRPKKSSHSKKKKRKTKKHSKPNHSKNNSKISKSKPSNNKKPKKPKRKVQATIHNPKKIPKSNNFPLYIIRDGIGTTQLFTNYNYTIKQLKQQISDEILHTPLNAFRISIHNLKPLNKEDITLCDYNIQTGMRIRIHTYTHTQVRQMQNAFHLTIQIKNVTHNGTIYYGSTDLLKIFSVQKTHTVRTLKVEIARKNNIKVCKQILSTMSGVVLNDEFALNSYDINDGDCLYLEITLCDCLYFNELLKDGIVSLIDINRIYGEKTDLKNEIFGIYYKFSQAMIALNGEMVCFLQIERNKKQNLLVYESLLSTLKNKTERFLFHGTTFANAEKIIMNGFNRDYNINAKYGKGTYFAASARYAALYSNEHAKTGHYALLVCRCITGNCGLGKQQMNESELYDTCNPGMQYDCLVNDLHDPQIYVINRDYHAVPVYIIVFKYKTSDNN